jgi:hypothetical protein
MSSKCPEMMTEIKDLVPWLCDCKIRPEVDYIRRETNLVDVPTYLVDVRSPWNITMEWRQRDLSICGPCSSPRNKSCFIWSSQPWGHRCTDPFACTQNTVASKRYLNLPPVDLQPWFHEVQRLSPDPTDVLLPAPHWCVKPSTSKTPTGHRRDIRKSRGSSVDSGLRLYVKDDSRVHLSTSQECQHVFSSDVRDYNKKLLGTWFHLWFRGAIVTGWSWSSTVKSYDQKRLKFENFTSQVQTVMGASFVWLARVFTECGRLPGLHPQVCHNLL